MRRGELYPPDTRKLLSKAGLFGFGQHLLRELVAGAVGIAAKAAEFFFDAKTRRLAEIVYERDQMVFLRGIALNQLFSTQTGRGNRKEFGCDFDETAEQDLLPLEFGTVTKHRMEKRAR